MNKFLAGMFLVLAIIMIPWRLLGFNVQVMMGSPGFVQSNPSDDGYWPAQNLEAQLEAWGWDVRYVPIRQMGVYGLTNTKSRIIQVDRSLHWSDRYIVLVHEAAHTLQPGWLDKIDEEIFAESVAALIDPNGMREHARYLSPYKSVYFFTSMAEWRAIYATAAVLRQP